MHKLKKYWEKVSADPVKIEEMEEIVCEALEEVRGRCPRLFWDTAYKLHENRGRPWQENSYC
jgi:hypothetical protein